MPATRRPVDERLLQFKEHLRRRGLKSTAQRDAIARRFFSIGNHISVEALYHDVKARRPHIGYATVYRTMKLLDDCGLASKRHFRDGETRYENAQEQHHDHLICERCGRIVEFTDGSVEALQEEIARRLGFQYTGHKMELYGVCRDCARRTSPLPREGRPPRRSPARHDG